ncbi:UNVERIFIED_CONTAM: hypothetical protein PYX00_009649 [Menopon gallinae]|uniref:Methyltransferase-like 26 n=1 Tax=Menopon gallinae TaxID=328185 RepID=A0AAW2HCB4_9NEOP
MFRKSTAPAAERNKEPILQELKNIIKVPEDKEGFPCIRILEISSGSGQHVAHFAKHLPKTIFWQPSEFDRSSFPSICAYIQEDGLENVAPPIFIDIREKFSNWKPVNEVPGVFKIEPITRFTENSFDYIYNSNLIHISSFDCAEGLFMNSGKLLKKNGSLITYGPYSQNGILTPESNVAFDAGLRASNPSWGVRDIQNQLVPLATKNGLELVKIIDMPANNKIVIWTKQ